MGIRFRCPNGHNLNVKSYQAGLRGVCPYCGAKFTVPAESTLPEEDKAGGEEQTEGTGDFGEPSPPQAEIEVSGPPPAEEKSESVGKTSPNPLSEAPDTLWYVRPPSGGQFGPADANVMREWIREGRVTADSLIWREGWPDWVEAVTVFPRLCDARWLPDDAKAKKPTPPHPPIRSQEDAGEERPAVETFVEKESEGKRAAEKKGLARRGLGRHRLRSAREIKKRRLRLVIGLSVLVVAMAGVAIWILMR